MACVAANATQILNYKRTVFAFEPPAREKQEIFRNILQDASRATNAADEPAGFGARCSVQVGMRLDQRGARPLIAAIIQGPSPDLGRLVFGDGVNPILARLRGVTKPSPTV